MPSYFVFWKILKHSGICLSDIYFKMTYKYFRIQILKYVDMSIKNRQYFKNEKLLELELDLKKFKFILRFNKMK